MKTLGSFLDKKTLARQTVVDEKSVFYIFSLIIKQEYGIRGSENVIPVFFKDRKIFIKVESSFWASEISLNKGQIVKKVNQQLGGEEIVDLAMQQ